MEDRTKLLQKLNLSLENEIQERKMAQAALSKLNRELMAISSCNQVLVRAEDEQTLLNDICRIVCEEAGYKLAWVGYAENDAAKTVRPVAQYGFDDGYAANANITWDENSPHGQGATGKAIRSGRSVFTQNLLHDPKYKPWLEEAQKRGFQSSIALPMRNDQGQVFGAFMLYSSEPEAITQQELRMLEELTGDLAYGITAIRLRNAHRITTEALRQSEQHYHSLFDRVNDGVYRSTREGKFVNINPAMVRMFGYASKEEMMEVDIERDLYFLPEERNVVNMVIGSHQTEIFRMRRKDGSEIWVEDNGNYEFDEYENTIYHEGILRDVTERVKVEEALIKAKEQAELSDKLKTVFLQNISHEIRTPMNAINGFTQLLNNPELSPTELAEYTGIVQKNIDQLIAIITNIITISSLETNQEQVRVQLTSINDILDEKPFLFKEVLKARGCVMVVEKTLMDAQTLIHTDGTKLSEVLNHLISNALKFTKNGTVTIGYQLKGQELEFHVRDTGIGIEPDMLEIIFDPFRKANNEPMVDINGTGLGLSISRGYVHLLGGTLQVASEWGKGSDFYFNIPYQPAF